MLLDRGIWGSVGPRGCSCAQQNSAYLFSALHSHGRERSRAMKDVSSSDSSGCRLRLYQSPFHRLPCGLPRAGLQYYGSGCNASSFRSVILSGSTRVITDQHEDLSPLQISN